MDKNLRENNEVVEKISKNTPCKYFKNGYCRFSQNCKFSHTIGPSSDKFRKSVDIKSNENRSNSTSSNVYNCNSTDHQSEAEHAKLKGNKFYMDGDYSKAFEMYSLAIIYSTEALATFYSNRSNTSIQMKDYYKAMADAEKCIELRPNWSKGYYRKAICLMNLGDKENSQKYFRKSFESAVEDKEKEEIKKFILEKNSDPKSGYNTENKSSNGKLLNFLSKYANDDSKEVNSSDEYNPENSIQDQLDFLMSQFIKPYEEDAFRSLAVYHGLDSGELSKESANEWIKFAMSYGVGDSPDLLKALKEYVELSKANEIKEKLEEIYDLCGFL